MDALQQAVARRAMDNLQTLVGSGPSHAARAKAFSTIARGLLAAGNQIGLEMLRGNPDALVQKATAEALDVSDLWHGPDAQALASAYLASIAEGSLFDLIKIYARVLPPRLRMGMVASDAVADLTTQGAPKPVINLALSITDAETMKAAAIIAMTSELARATGEEGRNLFERELRESITRAMNASVLQAFVDSHTPTASAGADPLASLRAGLLAAGPSQGYVVAAGTGATAWLATSEACRGDMTPRGGLFVPGVHIVAIDDMAAGQMVIIPASRVALFDGGLRMAATNQAAIDLRDSPESPSQLVSLFQTNTVAILCEREWHLAGDAEAVVVGGAG